MPTRASRRDRNRKGTEKCSPSAAATRVDSAEDRVTSPGMPASSNSGIADDHFEAEVGPLPEGMEPGQTVKFEYRGAWYEVAVPEGVQAGSNFKVALVQSAADAKSDDSTCVGDSNSDPSELEEDPMWSTDWTAERVPTARDHDSLPALDNVEWSKDCCIEEQPDIIAFENHRLPDPCQVYDLSDVTTWFTRMQQRREQALRSGKSKLVRKIDREIDLQAEKSRQQGSTDSQAAICNPTASLDEETADMDGIWGQDWASLDSAGCGGVA